MIMSAHADGVTRIAFPTQETLARELGWCSKNTGNPDRRRIGNALDELIETRFVYKHGTRPTASGWVRQYLVAPFPEGSEEAHKGYASPVEVTHTDAHGSRASTRPSTRSGSKSMRTVSSSDAHGPYLSDAYEGHAQNRPGSDLVDQTSETEEREEQQPIKAEADASDTSERQRRDEKRDPKAKLEEFDRRHAAGEWS